MKKGVLGILDVGIFMEFIYDGLRYEEKQPHRLIVNGFADNILEYVFIPEQINGKKVVGINSEAFSDISSLKAISFPACLEDIWTNAFWNCASLDTITFREAEQVETADTLYIGEGAFNYCSSLKILSLPSSVIAIGMAAFCECSSLESVIIQEPTLVQSKISLTLYQDAFAYCTKLKSFTAKARDISVHDGVFSGCSALSELSCIIKKIEGTDAFYNCEALTELTFNEEISIPDVDSISPIHNSNVKILNFQNKANLGNRTLEYIRNNDVRIRCRETSELINLAFDGYQIEIVE